LYIVAFVKTAQQPSVLQDFDLLLALIC
jgi:hypothetical protein